MKRYDRNEFKYKLCFEIPHANLLKVFDRLCLAIFSVVDEELKHHRDNKDDFIDVVDYLKRVVGGRSFKGSHVCVEVRRSEAGNGVDGSPVQVHNVVLRNYKVLHQGFLLVFNLAATLVVVCIFVTQDE